jgi:outer membrane protein insertion porin family
MNSKIIKSLLFLYMIVGYASFATTNINFSTPVDTITFKGITSKKINKDIKSIQIKTTIDTQINKRFLDEDLKNLYLTGYFSSIFAHSIPTQNKHILEFNFTQNSTIKLLTIKTKSKKIKTLIEKEFKHLLNQPLNTAIINKKKEKLTTYIQKKGYQFFTFSNIKFNKENNNLTIKTSEGTIEKITFIGLEKIKKDQIMRTMNQHVGSALNTIEIRKDRERLIKLGYFNFVSAPKFKKGSQSDTVEIIFNIIESKQNLISIGIEQDQNLFYGFVSTTKQNSIITSDSLFLKSQIQVNENTLKINNYFIKYTQPWLLNKYNTKTSLSNYAIEKAEILDNSSTYSQRNGFQIAFSRPLSYRSDYTLTFKKENVSETDESYGINDYNLNSIELSLLFETLSNKTNPKKGHSIQLSIERGNDFNIISLGGISFTKFTTSISKFFQIHKKLILATNLQGGIYDTKDTSINTFENEYFILGGSTSIRGYSDLNESITGKRNILTNIELRYNTSQTMQFISFIDYGNAFDTNVNLDTFKTGYGIGFRYITPIGPIRLDLATGEENYYIHVGLGQLF